MPSLALSKPTASFSYSIPRSSLSYDAGEEKELYSESGCGFAIILHRGDGDSALTTRIYIDDNLEASIEADQFDVFFVAFKASVSIKSYASTSGSFYNSTVEIAGFKRI